MITTQDVAKRVEYLEGKTRGADPEHRALDADRYELYRWVLFAIANGLTEDPVSLAREAMRVDQLVVIDFRLSDEAVDEPAD